MKDDRDRRDDDHDANGDDRKGAHDYDIHMIQ